MLILLCRREENAMLSCENPFLYRALSHSIEFTDHLPDLGFEYSN
jgi:hypothetical protein